MKTLEGKSNSCLAILLNLTEEEVSSLAYIGLYDIRDEAGKITAFYIQISTSNQRHLLSKLKMDGDRFIYFTPEEVNSAFLQVFSSLMRPSYAEPSI